MLSFKDVHALVIGDAILDRYHFGHIDRMSPEAPIPIFIEDRQELRDGGALNVASQLRALGCQVTCSVHYSSSVKHRYFVDHHPVFRIDADQFCTPSEQDINTSLSSVLSPVRNIPDVVVLSDYAKGWVSKEMAQVVINAAKASLIPVIVDPKDPDWSKFKCATVICPNEKEWSTAHHVDPTATIVLKQGEKGITVFSGGANLSSADRISRYFPAPKRHVYDVTGAGDTVVAVIAAVIGAGGSVTKAVQLAILAAGHVVGEVGTAVCSWEVLSELVEQHEKQA